MDFLGMSVGGDAADDPALQRRLALEAEMAAVRGEIERRSQVMAGEVGRTGSGGTGQDSVLQLLAARATPPAANYISLDFGRPQQPAAAPKAVQQQGQQPGSAGKAPQELGQGQAKATGVGPAGKAAQLQEQGQAKPAGVDSRKRKALPEEHRELAKQQKVAAPQPILPVAPPSRPASRGATASGGQGGDARAVQQQQQPGTSGALPSRPASRGATASGGQSGAAKAASQQAAAAAGPPGTQGKHPTPSLRPDATIFRPQSRGPASTAAPGRQNVAARPPAPQAAAAVAPASSGMGRASTSSAGASGRAPVAAKPAAAAPANPPAVAKPAAGGSRPSAGVAAAATLPGAVIGPPGPTQQRTLKQQLKAAAPVQPGRPAAEEGGPQSTAPAPGVSPPLPAGRPPSTAPEQQPAPRMPGPPSPAGRLGLQLPPGSSPPVGWPPQFAGLAPGFLPGSLQRRISGSPTAPRSSGGLPALPQSLPFAVGQQSQAAPQPNAFSFNHGLAAFQPAGPTTLRPRVPGPQPPPLARPQYQSAGQKRKASALEASSGAPMASTSRGAALRISDPAAPKMRQLGRPSPGSLARLPASNGRGQAPSAKAASHGAAATKQAAAAKQPAAAAAARQPEAPAEPSNDFARDVIVAELRSFDALFTIIMKDEAYLTKALRQGPFIRQSWKRLQLIGNLYAININVNTAQAANVAAAVEGRRFHGVPPPKASYVTLHRRINSSLKTDHGRWMFRFLLEFTRTQNLTLGFWGEAANLAFRVKNDLKSPPEVLQQLASFISAGRGEATPQEPSSEPAAGSEGEGAAAAPPGKAAGAAAGSEPPQRRIEPAGNAASQPPASASGGSTAGPAATAPSPGQQQQQPASLSAAAAAPVQGSAAPGQQQQPTDSAAAWQSPASLLASVIAGPQPGPQQPNLSMLLPQPAVAVKQEAEAEPQVGRPEQAAKLRRYSWASLTWIESKLRSKGRCYSAAIQQAIRAHGLAKTQLTDADAEEQEPPPPAGTQAVLPEQAKGSPISTAWNSTQEREWSSKVAKRQMRFAGDGQQQQSPAEEGEVPAAAAPTAAAKSAAPSAPVQPGSASGTSQAAAARKPADSLAMAAARLRATAQQAAALRSSAGARAAAQAPGRSQPADSAAARPEPKRPEALETSVAPQAEASLEEGELVASPGVVLATAGGGREQADAQPPVAPRPSAAAPADRTSAQSAQEPVFTFSPPRTLKLGPAAAAAVPTQEDGPPIVYQFGGKRGQYGTDPSTGSQPMAPAHQAKPAAAAGTPAGVLACNGVAESPASAAGAAEAAQRGDGAAAAGMGPSKGPVGSSQDPAGQAPGQGGPVPEPDRAAGNAAQSVAEASVSFAGREAAGNTAAAKRPPPRPSPELAAASQAAFLALQGATRTMQEAQQQSMGLLSASSGLPSRPGSTASQQTLSAARAACAAPEAAAAEQQRGAGPGQQAAAVSAAAQLAGPATLPTGGSQEMAWSPVVAGPGDQAGSAPLPIGPASPAGLRGQQSGPMPTGPASPAGLQGQGVPASFSAAAAAASTVFGQGSALVALSDAAGFSVLHVMQALERFCTQGWPNPVMLNDTTPDEEQQVQALAALHGVTVAATKVFGGTVLQRTAQAGLPTPEGSVVASRIAEHGGSPPSDPLALAQACGLAMLLQRRPSEALPTGLHMMLEAAMAPQRIMAHQHSGALLRLAAPPNAGQASQGRTREAQPLGAGPSPLDARLTLPAAAAGDASALPGEHQPSQAHPAPTGTVPTGAVPTGAGAHQAAGGGPPAQDSAGSSELGDSGAAQVHLNRDGGSGRA